MPSTEHTNLLFIIFGEDNILNGPGLWDRAKKDVDEQKNTFIGGSSICLGKLSSNGKYVAPNDLDCSADSFPGVWDVEKKMKVVFPLDKDDSVVESQCQELFIGSKSMNELGGTLLPKNIGHGAK
ncbi:hypothetical protein IOR24_03770 [Enterobacter cloacae]|uniref:hypothetical protein n=1 Tax=Enterobacter cloacae TaxID=550 RepID=UPI0018C2E171|nr:hypothetical protein [Enterobacter cloacae]MBG0521081.1 hypothetical protein [Enterobacter cloacae]